jgi:hypothetical protein
VGRVFLTPDETFTLLTNIPSRMHQETDAEISGDTVMIYILILAPPNLVL